MRCAASARQSGLREPSPPLMPFRASHPPAPAPAEAHPCAARSPQFFRHPGDSQEAPPAAGTSPPAPRCRSPASPQPRSKPHSRVTTRQMPSPPRHFFPNRGLPSAAQGHPFRREAPPAPPPAGPAPPPGPSGSQRSSEAPRRSPPSYVFRGFSDGTKGSRPPPPHRCRGLCCGSYLQCNLHITGPGRPPAQRCPEAPSPCSRTLRA